MKIKSLFASLVLLTGMALGQSQFSGGSNGPGGGSGTVSTCSTVGGNAFYAATGTTVSCDASIIDSGAGALTLNSLATASNGNLTIAPNGTGAAIFNDGTATNPSIQFAGMASNTGLFGTANSIVVDFSGGQKVQFASGNVQVGNGVNITWSQTAAANGTSGPNFSVTGTGANEYIVATTPIIITGACKVISGLTIATTPTNICVFTLPNSASSLLIDCQFTYTESTATTLALSYTFAQAPTTPSFSANILTSNTNTATQGTNTTGGTTANTILTGATPGATGSFIAYLNGTFTSSATSGTLTISGTAGAASAVTLVGGCHLE